ncbi:MAG: acyl-CoA dehydrogenase family protein [Solirubrobacterales bacterium]|nr:acyl-CoA dehydrogenase family protein [Solirubrobacterales bacterium]
MTTAPVADTTPSPMPEAELAALTEEVRDYVADDGERWAQRIERERAVPMALWVQLRDRGYLNLAAPVAYGGRGLPFTQYLPLLELFAMSHASLRMIVHVCNGVWRPVDSHASLQQRERFVLPLVAGDIKVAFTLTEPTAGTGADLRCSVVREGDTYYLSGEKHLITFGTIADYLLLFARVEGTTGADGTVALLVPPHGEGIDATVMPETMGVRGTDHGQFVFDRAPVPVANRLGEEGDGLGVALSGFLAPSRIAVAMTCVGLAQRAFDLALEYAQRRETFGKVIAKRQAIAFTLAEMATEIQAARALVMQSAQTWEAGGDANAASAMSKLFAVTMLQRVTDDALQVHGGIGYWSSSPIERVYRDARAQRFEEGTNEIQKTVIARDLLR